VIKQSEEQLKRCVLPMWSYARKGFCTHDLYTFFLKPTCQIGWLSFTKIRIRTCAWKMKLI